MQCHFGLESAADGVEQVGEGRVAGALRGRPAGRAHASEFLEVGLGGGAEFGVVGHRGIVPQGPGWGR